MRRLLFYLKASRPGLWFPTIWLYLLPTSGMDVGIVFWVGLFYVSFPLNFLVYGWNDIVDEDIDRYNPRKDTYLFGAKGGHDELSTLPTAMICVQLVIWPFLVYLSSWHVLWVLLGTVFFCWITTYDNRIQCFLCDSSICGEVLIHKKSSPPTWGSAPRTRRKETFFMRTSSTSL